MAGTRHYSVIQAGSNKRLWGNPTTELVKASLAVTDTGQVGAYWDGKVWQYCAESQRWRLTVTGHIVQTVYCIKAG